MSDGLRLQMLHKRFGDQVALNGLSLHVPKGSLIGFLGPNGSGKTTAMRSVMGMVKPDTGTITWDGTPVDDETRHRIGYMPQERGLYARMKAREQIIYFGRLAGLDAPTAALRADYWLERLDLSDRSDALLQELSGGNQQRVQLAVALIHDPDILILDEPFAGLDPVAANKMQEIITERTENGACVLFSSHQLDLVSALTKDAIIVAEGAVVAEGAIDDLRSRSPIRRLRVRCVGRRHLHSPSPRHRSWRRALPRGCSFPAPRSRHLRPARPCRDGNRRVGWHTPGTHCIGR